jgi:hypothetical protein
VERSRHATKGGKEIQLNQSCSAGGCGSWDFQDASIVPSASKQSNENSTFGGSVVPSAIVTTARLRNRTEPSPDAT